MSVTAASNAQTYSLHSALADYEIHHTSATDPLDPTLNAHPLPDSSRYSNPANWPTDERRVPPYRPINTELDQSERRVYQNGVERAFVTVMFSGVFLEATASKIWRATLGRVWNVEYKIGGEW
ncbi:hypothetical protein BU23DRAFT_469978 [Bimuria novae-zelandiae CBS 107.79]|uniref:Uncharacterized protein n=1 Tax=Bimuria novae-zelandiae CBS 107.79 TaxID=1447943 RepID=A0A6A5V328_9PLEO|nr:hypothetical protein BU23DRAFT_469978 [Bimuria novae-zelandiae CBS 107.79]